MHNLIDKYLLPNAEDPESKVFYLRLKGDHYRYLWEISKDIELDKAIENAEKVYKEAYAISEKDLPNINSIRFGLSLNMALFYYEIKGDKKEGCKIAKSFLKNQWNIWMN